MKLVLFAVLPFFLVTEEIPFKPKEEFELKLDLQFKQRPKPDVNTVRLSEPAVTSAGMPAPYLHINLKVLKPNPEEMRVRVTRGKEEVLLSRKFDPAVVIKLDLGFTDDIKDRVSPHDYFITFLTKEKKPISKIEIFFEKDGSYLVNGEKRGRL